MTTLAFDTHGLVKDLTKAGISEQQAEVIVGGMTKLHASSLDELATKNDLAHLETRMFQRLVATAAVVVAAQSAIIGFIMSMAQ